MTRRRVVVAALALFAAAPSPAEAVPWMRDRGHFFLELSYSRISATRLYSLDFSTVPIARYTQQALGVYGELGLVNRWLMLSLEGQLYRRSTLDGQGTTDGLGDLRLGFWTGLVESPVRLSFGALFGLPTGDSSPSAGPGVDPLAREIARSLPTGDGEFDAELRLSLGWGWNGSRRWPLRHYLIAEAGYWIRTQGWFDAFTWKAEVGVKLPWRVIDRLWLGVAAGGVESFATTRDLQENATPNATGLGNGVTYTWLGLKVFINLWRGVAVGAQADGAARARLVPAALNVKVGLSCEY